MIILLPLRDGGHFSHGENHTNTHEWLCAARGRASIYLPLLRTLSLSLFDLSSSFSLFLSLFFPVSNSIFFFPEKQKTGSPSGVINVSHYHSDISQTDVGAVSVPNLAALRVNIRMSWKRVKRVFRWHNASSGGHFGSSHLCKQLESPKDFSINKPDDCYTTLHKNREDREYWQWLKPVV